MAKRRACCGRVRADRRLTAWGAHFHPRPERPNTPRLGRCRQARTDVSQYAAGVEGAKSFVVIEFTVVNGSSTPYDPISFNASAQSGNTEASRIFDSEKKVGIKPTTKVLPGREAKFSLAFGVSDPADLVVQVAPGYKYEQVLFTS